MGRHDRLDWLFDKKPSSLNIQSITEEAPKSASASRIELVEKAYNCPRRHAIDIIAPTKVFSHAVGKLGPSRVQCRRITKAQYGPEKLTHEWLLDGVVADHHEIIKEACSL